MVATAGWCRAAATVPARARWLAFPLVLYAAYIVSGAIVRLPFLYDVRPSVRASAVAAVLVTLGCTRRGSDWDHGSRAKPGRDGAVVIVAVLMAGDLAQYGQWAAGRTYKNVTASRLLGEWLPPGTLVQGSLRTASPSTIASGRSPSAAASATTRTA